MVKIVKVKKGYFLTIGDKHVDNTWAVTESELKELLKKLNNMYQSNMNDT